MLIGKGASPDLLNNAKCTALYVAVSQGFIEVVRTLCEFNCDVNLPVSFGFCEIWDVCVFAVVWGFFLRLGGAFLCLTLFAALYNLKVIPLRCTTVHCTEEIFLQLQDSENPGLDLLLHPHQPAQFSSVALLYWTQASSGS